MKLALRVLAREKAFVLFAVLTLALGIGAVTTIFSVVDVTLLKPLAYREPGRLYGVHEQAKQFAASYPKLPVNAAHFRSWSEECKNCAAAALVNPATFNLTGDGEPERVEGVSCTWQLFEVLGTEPGLGRTFRDSDDQPGGANKFVVVSDAFWRRRLRGDPSAVGQTIRLGGDPHVVVGVLRPDFRFPSGDQVGPLNRFPKHADIFKPTGIRWASARRVGQFNYSMILRLRPGASVRAAEAEMAASIGDVSREMKTEVTAHLTPLQEQITGGSRGALTLLLAAVGVVLLIVCVNIGSLMLVRASERSRDAAIRRALGAENSHLFGPVLVESLIIAFAGGVLGVAFAYAGVRLLVTQAPVQIPRLDEVHVSLTALAFAFLVSAGCGILCGLWPALRTMRTQPVDALRSGSRSTTAGRDRQQTREWLVGLEVALSTVLLVVGGLLGLSLFRVTTVDRGYAVDHVLSADLSAPGTRYPKDEQRALFHQRALEKLEALPGVRSAGLVSSLPLKAQVWGDSINKEGDTRNRVERPLANFRFISERYFESMGVALREGRFPVARDRERRVAVVSESAARAAWRGESPVGKRIRNEPNPEWVEVIGVVADVRTESLEKRPPAMVYVPYWDGKYWQGNVWGTATYVIRTAQDPAAMAGAFRGAIRELDAEMPVANLLTMTEIVSESTSLRRFQTQLSLILAAVALILASIGLYGVISYSVARRTNEMGIRIALGAQARQISMLVFRQGARPVLGGVAVGVVAALALGQVLASYLFGTQAQDPLAFSGAVAASMMVAAFACWIPARRAARIEPMRALRDE